jgi:hypothetical protein
VNLWLSGLQRQAGVTKSEPKLNHPRYLISYFIIYFCIYFFSWLTPMSAALSTTDLFIVSVIEAALLEGKHNLETT